MALPPPQRQIGVRAPGNVGGVDARMPYQRDTGLQEAINSVVRPVVAAAEEDLRVRTTDNANAVEIGRNDEGYLTRPADPEGMGPVAQRAWREALDRRFIMQSVQDASQQMDDLRVQSQNDPQAFRELARPVIERRLAAMDAPMRGQILPYLEREYGERFRQISVFRMSQEQQATETAIRADLARDSDDLIDAEASGDAARAAQLRQRIAGGYDLLGRMGRDRTSPESRGRIVESLSLAGRILGTASRELEAGTADPLAFGRLAMGLNGGPMGDGAFGFTVDELSSLDPGVRRALRSRLTDLSAQATRMMTAQAQEQRVGQIIGLFEASPGLSFRELGIRPEDQRAVVDAFASRNGIDRSSPAGLRTIITTFGQLPENLREQLFDGMRSSDLGRIERAGTLFASLEQFQGRDGQVRNLTHELKTEDAVFLYHYNRARSGPGSTPENAANIARAAMERGLGRNPAEHMSMLRETAQVRTDADLIKKLEEGWGTYWPLDGDRRNFARVQGEARQEYVADVARRVAYGMPFEVAQRTALASFTANWTKDDRFTTAAGRAQMKSANADPWVRRSVALPAIRDVWGGSPHHEYVEDAVRLYVENRIPDTQALTGLERYRLQLGRTLFLEPPRNPTENNGYTLVYMTPEGRIEQLQDRDGNPARIYLGRVLRQQQEFADNYEVARASLERQVKDREEAEIAATLRGASNEEVGRLTALTTEAREALARSGRPARMTPVNDEFGLGSGSEGPVRRPGPPIRLEDITTPPAMRPEPGGAPRLGNVSADLRGRLAPFSEVPRIWQPDVDAAAQSSGVDRDLLANVARVESGWRHGAVSERGAGGLMQIMPGTAAELAARYGGDPSRPRDNLRLGAHYLREMQMIFRDDVLAVAAYNWGPGAMTEYREGKRTTLPTETIRHVRRVFRMDSDDAARAEIERRARRGG